jgi:hypothetical protein
MMAWKRIGILSSSRPGLRCYILLSMYNADGEKDCCSEWHDSIGPSLPSSMMHFRLLCFRSFACPGSHWRILIPIIDTPTCMSTSSCNEPVGVLSRTVLCLSMATVDRVAPQCHSLLRVQGQVEETAHTSQRASVSRPVWDTSQRSRAQESILLKHGG